MSAVRASAVLVGLAEYLHAQGVAVWSPAAPYQASDRAISLKSLPSSPGNAVALSVYDVEDDLVLPHVPVYVQARFRAAQGARTAVDDFADDAFNVLHGRRFAVAGMTVHQCRRVSVAPLGADDNAREERADNYELIFRR